MGTLAQRIRTLRLRKGISQRELADMVECSKQLISKYESGEVENIPYDKMGKLALALETTTAFLSGKEESQHGTTAVQRKPVTVRIEVISDHDFPELLSNPELMKFYVASDKHCGDVRIVEFQPSSCRLYDRRDRNHLRVQNVVETTEHDPDNIDDIIIDTKSLIMAFPTHNVQLLYDSWDSEKQQWINIGLLEARDNIMLEREIREFVEAMQNENPCSHMFPLLPALAWAKGNLECYSADFVESIQLLMSIGLYPYYTGKP